MLPIDFWRENSNIFSFKLNLTTCSIVRLFHTFSNIVSDLNLLQRLQQERRGNWHKTSHCIFNKLEMFLEHFIFSSSRLLVSAKLVFKFSQPVLKMRQKELKQNRIENVQNHRLLGPWSSSTSHDQASTDYYLLIH